MGVLGEQAGCAADPRVNTRRSVAMQARWLVVVVVVLGCGAGVGSEGMESSTSAEVTTSEGPTSGGEDPSGAGLVLKGGHVVGVGVADVKIVGGEIVEVE